MSTQPKQDTASVTTPRQIGTIDDAAKRYSLSRSHLYHLVERREIPFLKVGKAVRLDFAKLDRWFDGLEVAPLAQVAK